MPDFRVIPSLDAVVGQAALAPWLARLDRQRVVTAARAATDALRTAIALGTDAPQTTDAALTWLAEHVARALDAGVEPSLRRVINATGVIIHTNLGRAPLSAQAAARASDLALGYSNLEYDLEKGGRGRREVHAERLLQQLTGAPAALVVNNNAAATLVVMAALGSGREVIVSRGELVEIGGGFRVPDVMAQSGALLREVGTTNRTRAADYAAAISDRTALILRVHPSNFRVEGFTERPAAGELAALAHRFGVPLFEDLGSGWIDPALVEVAALGDEPSVTASLAAGADIVSFSGDKLLGGPQCGLIVGSDDLIDQVRRHPLMRAMRAGKMTYAALEATLGQWLSPDSRAEIPVVRMLTMTADEVRARASRLIETLSGVPGLTCGISPGASTTGGGSAPASQIPTWLVTLRHAAASAASLARELRAGDLPVVTRIVNDEVVVDLRTVDARDDRAVTETISGAVLRIHPD
jgi:L-seryl-tRNA(Ser) seleniumtransferase